MPVHAGIRPSDLNSQRAGMPGAELLVHPECGCSTQVMEYIASGDVAAEGTHMLSTGGMMRRPSETDAKQFIVATETGILHRLRQQHPGREFVPANRKAVCQYMKMITLPKLRDGLRDMRYQVSVDPVIADRARRPIERMLAIGA